jgi:bile acid:Na+ symporter, BASS family
MTLNPDIVIRILTIATLVGLLFSAGLRLTWPEIAASLRHNRLGWVLPVNFVLVPVLTVFLARQFRVSTDTAAGMVLLAAAPFAPVVPTFTRLAKGDLALASALTGLFPFLSAFATPLVCELSLRPFLKTSSLHFDIVSIFEVLVSTITLPLAAGVLMRHRAPTLARQLLKPVETLSEGIGAVALIFAVVAEFPSICSTGGKSLLAMALTSELAFLAGYVMSGPAPAARVVVALGTANRNIALALLVAVASFPGTPIVAMVVANGLLLILLGLIHVGWWRFVVSARHHVAARGN